MRGPWLLKWSPAQDNLVAVGGSVAHGQKPTAVSQACSC